MELQFVSGRAIIKQGRKVVAKIFDRAVFYQAHNIKCGIGQYPYSLEIGAGIRECATLDEAKEFLFKYTGIQL